MLRKVTVPPKAINPKDLLHFPSSEIAPWRGQRESLQAAEERAVRTRWQVSKKKFGSISSVKVFPLAISFNQIGYEIARFPLENYPFSPLETCQYKSGKGSWVWMMEKNEFLTGLLLDIQLFHWLASDKSDFIKEFQQSDTVEDVRRRCRGEAGESGVGQLSQSFHSCKMGKASQREKETSAYVVTGWLWE